jgi:PhnB protein
MDKVTTEPSDAGNYQRPGLKAITPYLVVENAAALLDLLQAAFGGVVRLRVPSSGGPVVHAAVAIGNGAVEVADATAVYPVAPGAIHLYVDDADATFARAIAAGAISVSAVEDQPWGDRQGTVRDVFSNLWYIARAGEWAADADKVSSVQPYLHVPDADALTAFVAAAFGAESLGAARSPEGLVLHDTLRIGDATFELDDSRAGNAAMPCCLHIYVPDADAVYGAALTAGASSIEAPDDKRHGDRSTAVIDRWGNRWLISTYISS